MKNDLILQRRARTIMACALVLMLAWSCMLVLNLLHLRIFYVADDIVGLVVCWFCYRYARQVAVLVGWFKGAK